MAEFRLPKDSRVRVGHKHNTPEGMKSPQKFEIYRWNPDDGVQTVLGLTCCG